jgi:outer membrane protein TolC
MRLFAGPVVAAVVIGWWNPAHGDDLPSPLRLDDLLTAVQARNPAVAERRRKAAAARLRPRAESLPDDPMAMLEWWQQPVNFSTVPVMLTLKQTIPWRSRLKLRRESAEAEARAIGDEADESELHALADARRAYFELVLAERSGEVNRTVQTLEEKLVKTSDALYRVGKAVQADLLKAQSELLLTENDGFDLDRDREVTIAKLNALLDRPASSPFPPIATTPEVKAVAPEPTLVERALRNRPATRRAVAMLEAAKQRAALARTENYPELAISTSYMVMFRGVDTFTLGLSSTLPFWGTVRKRAQASAADAEVEAATRALDGARRDTEAQVHATLHQLEAAARHVRLHGEKLIPLADLTMESALASYEAGRVPFTTVIDAARMVRDHHLNHIKFLVEYEKALADLSELVGGDVFGSDR